MKKKIITIISAIVGIIILGMGICVLKSYEPEVLAKESLISDNKIEVKNDDFISFTPKEQKVSKGFVFYPGAGVKPEAYAPVCREIALQGYEVIIAKIPLNLAVLSPNAADEIISAYDDIDTWVIGGHSLGGVMASKYASTHDNIKGVVFYASYPSGDELKKSGLEVISLYGNKDGVVNQDNLFNSKDNLPKDTEFVEIDGGNHSQFGDYGLQEGDNEATIDGEKQLSLTVEYTVGLLNKVK